MNDNYILKHKDVSCALLAIDRDNGNLAEVEILKREYAPFLGSADLRLMKIWWEHRTVPAARKEMEEIIKATGCETPQVYLAKNLALSMTDTYWICPMEIELTWSDVNLFRIREQGDGIVAWHNETSYDPNASLGGEMNKYWDVSGSTPVLVKRAYSNYGQQSINEFFATMIHERQGTEIPFVKYAKKAASDNAVLSCCDSFTTGEVEFIPAAEVLNSGKRRASVSDFDQFMKFAVALGLDGGKMQEFMDYLIISDFAISNVDEHYYNFGVLRDAETMKLIGPAPIFDSGNSMFFDKSRTKPLSRKELLAQRINSFCREEEKMLRHVKNKNVFDVGKLPGMEEVHKFYEEHGMPPERAEFIAASYRNKIEILRDFQAGQKISLHIEKQRR